MHKDPSPGVWRLTPVHAIASRPVTNDTTMSVSHRWECEGMGGGRGGGDAETSGAAAAEDARGGNNASPFGGCGRKVHAVNEQTATTSET